MSGGPDKYAMRAVKIGNFLFEYRLSQRITPKLPNSKAKNIISLKVS